MHTVIQIRDLSKSYTSRDGNIIEAVQEVSFEVAAGEFVSVVGPSGCGKSTLLKIIAGIRSKSSGVVLLQGTPVEGPRRDTGVVFQSAILLPWRNVMGNIMVPVEIQGLDRETYSVRALRYLELVGLKGFEEKYPRELSGGMQQRVGICRALVHDPAVMLMDEPFGALDAMTREHMNLELLDIWAESNKTILFITHSISEAVFMADRVIVLSPRPARILEVVNIDLPRPRRMEMLNSETLGYYTSRIREYFNSMRVVNA